MLMISMCIFFISLTVFLTGISLIKINEKKSFRIGEMLLIKNGFHIGFFRRDQWVEPLLKINKNIRRSDYEFGRFFISISFLFCAVIFENKLLVFLSFCIYLLLAPVERVGKWMSPFGLFIDSVEKSINRRKEAEIYDGICFLRNMLAGRSESPPGTDAVLEELIRYSKLLRPAYMSMLSYVRTNRLEEAIEAFSAEAGSAVGRDYGRLLIQLDEIPVGELEETLISYQRNIRDVKTTNQKKRDALISDLIFIPVTANMILVFLNFINVVFFLEQKAALESLIF